MINSGGHFHAGGPVGEVEPNEFTLGSNYPQNVPTVFTAPEFSGLIEERFTFTLGKTPVITNYTGVEIAGFIALDATTGIVLTGTTGTHPLNHYGTNNLVSSIQVLALAFHKKFNKNLFVNDMSVQWGGLFDHRATWRPPHQTHREGRTVDINSTSMNPAEKNYFRQTAASLGFSVTLENNPPHWHLFI